MLGWSALIVSLLATIVVGTGGGIPRELERDLRAERPSKRRRAVSRLAELDTRPAWRALFGALEDAEPEVADAAQLLLAGVRDRRLVDDLQGRFGLKHRDDWVAVRVAEAFGRFDVPIEGKPLARALDPRRADFSRALLWSIERLVPRGCLRGDPKRIAVSVKPALARNRSPDLRAAALTTFAVLDSRRASPIVAAALTDREAVVRASALATEARGADPLGVATRLASDDSHAVRVAALNVLEQHVSRGALGVLVDRLESEPRLRLRWRIVDILQRSTGRKYRLDPRPWRSFVEGLPSGWKPGTPSPPQRVGDRTATLAGMPILSDHVAFLIDFSGSLWHERSDGTTRKSVLDERIRAVLERLPPETYFNLIPYTGEPIPWNTKCVRASKRNVKAAAEFFEKCRETGRGNFYGAARLALQDPLIDTIVVLTDGTPTGGRHWNLGLMFDVLLEDNRYRSVVVDSILVDPDPRLVEDWQRLANATRGLSITVDLDAPATHE